MRSNIVEIVYVVKSADITLSKKKVLDFVMDDDRNIVCWRSAQNVEQFLKDNGLEHGYIAHRTTVAEIEEELESKKDITDGVGIRIIEGVDFM